MATASILLGSYTLFANTDVFAQNSISEENWNKFTLEDLGLEIEYPSDWVVVEDTERRGDLTRLSTQIPVPVISFDSEEKSSNQPPDSGIELPESIKETFENMPAAYLTIFTPNEIHSSSNNTVDDSKRALLYKEIDDELKNNLNTNNGVNGENITLNGLNQTVWKIDEVDKIGDEGWSKNNFLFFLNPNTNSVLEIMYSSDASKVDEYDSVFEYMLNSIKPVSLVDEENTEEEEE